MSNSMFASPPGDGAGQGSAARRLEDLLDENRGAANGALEKAIVDQRLLGFKETHWPPAQPGDRKPHPRVPNGELLDIHVSELSATVLHDAVIGGGGLLVRELMPPRLVAWIRDGIDRALEARRDLHQGVELRERSRWYHRSAQVQGGPQQFWAGSQDQRFDNFGSLWTVDSPACAFTLSEFYRDLGLPRMLADCFGEEAVLSAKKWVLRKVRPKQGVPSGWHQDGRFLGDGIRTVNLWVALSHCGATASAPGLEIIADNRKRIHETGTRGAMFDWVVGQELVDDLSRELPVLEPEFAAGDAVFFDHYNLHRTQCNALQTLPRYAVESWFFAASTAPLKQQPLLL